MMRRLATTTLCLAVFLVPAAEAQRSGQSATISVGVVKGVEDIDLRSQAAPAGALVGGMLAYHTTGSSRSSST